MRSGLMVVGAAHDGGPVVSAMISRCGRSANENEVRLTSAVWLREVNLTPFACYFCGLPVEAYGQSSAQ